MDPSPEDTACRLIESATTGALGVIDPGTGHPQVSRVAVGAPPGGDVYVLVSDLSLHTAALRANPMCSLLVGEFDGPGDPLDSARLTLTGRARFLSRGGARHLECRSHFLATSTVPRPYVDFADFHFVVIEIEAVFLNAGFGKAFWIDPGQLRPGRRERP